MPFIPHTGNDIQAMLADMGVASLSDLFSDIPPELCVKTLPGLPAGIDEMQLARLARSRAAEDSYRLCFIGAGAYEHHIPAAVWEVASRGEWMTAYTPYQPEASQGTLQLLYEYQSMMASLMGMDVSNASLYDGGSALAEAILMAVRLQSRKKNHRVLLPTTLHPYYRATVRTIVQQQDIELIDVPFSLKTGCIDPAALDTFTDKEISALIIPQPNFFGMLEDVDTLTDWAHAKNALAIGVVNPLAMALLKPPGQWGQNGTDIACGEGQPLGVPLASGGPYYGLLCCRTAFVRQLPGRIVGQTVDTDGRPGFVLTLQAREQHIRRARATSNICTSQGLLVSASTLYMSLLGPDGLRQVALRCHQQTQALVKQLTDLPGIKAAFPGSRFHECVLQLDTPVAPLLAALAEEGILGGLALTEHYPGLGNALLICVTETKTAEDLLTLTDAFANALSGTSVKGHAHA